jgi:hypothetical protein
LDVEVVEVARELGIHAREPHHLNDFTSDARGYVALRPALKRALARAGSCEEARDLGRVFVFFVTNQENLAFTAFAGPARQCLSPTDRSMPCRAGLPTEQWKDGRGLIVEGWASADGVGRNELLKGVQACSYPNELAKNLSFAEPAIVEGFIAEVKREERAVTRAVDAKMARERAVSDCQGACLHAFGISAARTGPDSTLCEQICQGDASCRDTCSKHADRCFRQCQGNAE